MKSFALALLVASSAAAQPAPRSIDLTAPDGTRLKGTYFDVAESTKAHPAVLLLHMCNTTRESWEPVARQLAAAGVSALTLDNRGFGESGGPRYTGATTEVQRDVNHKWPADFDAALAWLQAQAGVAKQRIGVGGGSCGVENAMQVASRHPNDVISLVLLAGSADIARVAYLQGNTWLPIFTAAAADDQYDSQAPQLMRWIAEVAGNPRNKFVGFKDGRHGTEIFGPHPELPRQIVAWFEETLITEPAKPGSALAPKKTPISEFWAAANQRGGAARASQLFRQARQHDPHAFLFPESPLNLLAYAKLQSADGADKDDAVELFRVNTEAYPMSANAQDSLADGYLARGQTERALAAERKCLELLPADPMNEQFKAQLRKVADEKIAKLKAKLE